MISKANLCLPDLLAEQNLSHKNFENCQNELLIYHPLCLATNNTPCPGTRKDQRVWAAISQGPCGRGGANLALFLTDLAAFLGP